jgi:DNA-binding transcriptional MerR regulator
MEKSSSPRAALADSSYFEMEPVSPARAPRGIGERGFERGERLVATVVERLSAVAAFDHLPDRDLYTIGELSAHLRVSLRTLRFYEQSSLLLPVRDGTRRLYTRRDLDRLKMIVILRAMEVSLSEIKQLMAAIEADEAEAAVFARVSAILAGLAAANEARIDELRGLNERMGRLGDRLGSVW